MISSICTSRGSEYGTPTMIIPWCSSVVWKLVIVVSWPPCWLAVLAKTLPTLPIRAPESQSLVVRSRKLRIWAHMLPNRVGVPKMIASASASWSGSMTGTWANAARRPSPRSSPGASSGTSSGT